MPLFSIIVPIYNSKKHLNKCINSIISQEFLDFEIILVDDGSKDGSSVICDQYADMDDRVKVIHKKNEGVSLARKSGIAIAEGEYLLFVDSDDWIELDFFEKIHEKIGTDIIRFGNYIVKPDGTKVENYPLEKEGFYSKSEIKSLIFPYLIQDNDATYYCPSLWCHAFKKELFVDNMIDTVIKIGEDGACVIPCVYKAESIYIMHHCLYNYNFNTTSATKSKKVYDWRGPELIAKHITSKMNILECDFQEQLYRKIVHELFTVVVSRFNSDDNFWNIRDDIIYNLKENETYRLAISKAAFSGSLSAKIMLISLRFHLIGLVALYSRVKRLH